MHCSTRQTSALSFPEESDISAGNPYNTVTSACIYSLHQTRILFTHNYCLHLLSTPNTNTFHAQLLNEAQRNSARYLVINGGKQRMSVPSSNKLAHNSITLSESSVQFTALVIHSSTATDIQSGRGVYRRRRPMKDVHWLRREREGADCTLKNNDLSHTTRHHGGWRGK